jgi:hypothetical protein
LVVFLHLENFFIEGDSSIVITALQNPYLVMDWHFDHVICNIFSLIPASSIWKVEKLTEVQTSVLITFHIGPWLEFTLAVFPPYLPSLF